MFGDRNLKMKIMEEMKIRVYFDYEKVYRSILRSGMFWEFFPEHTGVWDDDKKDWAEAYEKIFNSI